MVPRVRAVASAVIVMWVLTALSARAQTASPEELYRRAVGEHQAGDLEAAIRDYRACLALAPDNIAARSNLGAALAKQERYPEAIEQYLLALKADPSQDGIRVNLALAYYKTADFPKAIAELEPLHARHADDLRLALLLSDCYLRQGEFQHVVDTLRPLEPAHQDDRALAYLLGTALIRGGQVKEGEVRVDRILRDGDSAEARLLMATSALASHNYAAALDGFRRAIRMNPQLPSVYALYGQALLETGDAEGAAEAFGKQLAQTPGDFDANFRLGQIEQQRKQYEQALGHFHRALEARPGNRDVRYAVAAAQASLGQYQAARGGLEELLREVPSFSQAHRRLADVYEHLGLRAEALRERALAGEAAPVDDLKLRPGDAAPDFRLPLRGSAGTAGLSDYRGKKPVLLVFGSYTCPYLRASIGAINALYERYASRAGFLLVYIHEAHTAATWQSTRNEREGISLPPAASLAEKNEYASACARKLSVRFPVVVDGMGREVEKAYQGWPSAAYLVGTDGHIVWRSRLNEQNFDAAALEQALNRALTGTRADKTP